MKVTLVELSVPAASTPNVVLPAAALASSSKLPPKEVALPKYPHCEADIVVEPIFSN